MRFPDDETVREWVRHDFGLDMTQTELVVGGLDAEARVWLMHDAEGTGFAVKFSERDVRSGLLLATSLAARGVPGAPAPLPAADGRPWSDHGTGRLSITRWIVGREAFEGGLDGPEWEAVGRLLRAVHETPFPAPLDAPAAAPATRRGIRRTPPATRLRLREVDATVAAAAADTARRMHVPDPVRDALLADWPAARARALALREAARHLKRTTRRTPTTRVACHGDPHLGNLLVDEAGQPWLIDWDDAVEAPREVDLLLVELGVIFAQPVTAVEQEAFHRGYGPVVVDRQRLVRFGCIRAVEDVFDATLRILTTGDPEALDLLRGILSPAGLVGLVESQLEIDRAESRETV